VVAPAEEAESANVQNVECEKQMAEEATALGKTLE
jgi:hypothetical protein